jgi:hypothetical protein
MNRSARSTRAVLGVVAAAILFASAAGPAAADPAKAWSGDGGNSTAAQADHKPAGTGSGRKIG